MNCTDCHRALRPKGTTEENYPGTLTYWPGQRCHVCYTKGPKHGRRRGPDECSECHAPMHRATETPKPGQVPYGGRGMCKKHYNAARRREEPKDVATREAPVVEDPALMGFLAQRRKRQARQAAAEARLRARQHRVRRPVPTQLPVPARVDLDPTTGLWIVSKGGTVIGLAVSEALGWEQLGLLTRTAVAA